MTTIQFSQSSNLAAKRVYIHNSLSKLRHAVIVGSFGHVDLNLKHRLRWLCDDLTLSTTKFLSISHKIDHVKHSFDMWEVYRLIDSMKTLHCEIDLSIEALFSKLDYARKKSFYRLQLYWGFVRYRLMIQWEDIRKAKTFLKADFEKSLLYLDSDPKVNQYSWIRVLKGQFFEFSKFNKLYEQLGGILKVLAGCAHTYGVGFEDEDIAEIEILIKKSLINMDFHYRPKYASVPEIDEDNIQE